MFNCSIHYSKILINKYLIVGPDLANQIVGVLLRFRKEHMKFLADIKFMFYHVLVLPHQRSLLRFLWWEESHLPKKVVYYQMCTHIFGGFSSPSCLNFAYKKSTMDNTNEFGQEATINLSKSFYANGLLQSIKSVEDAIWLLKNIVPFRYVQLVVSSRLKLPIIILMC